GRARIILVHRLGKVAANVGPAAPLDQRFLGRRRRRFGGFGRLRLRLRLRRLEGGSLDGGRVLEGRRSHQRQEGRRDRHFPWQTFCSFVPRNGLNGQLTQRSRTPPPDAPATGTTIWSERIAAGALPTVPSLTPPLCRPRKLIMSSWSMPSPETPMPPIRVLPR